MPTIAKRKPSHLAPDGLPYHGLVRLQEVLAVLPVARSTLYAWVKSGKLPPPIHIGPRVSAWPVELIRALLGSPPADGPPDNIVKAVAKRKAKRMSEAEQAEAERVERRAMLLGDV